MKINKIVVYCFAVTNDSNSKWNETIANGQSINGECLEGFSGSVSRSCLQNDLIGVWDTISGSCQGYHFSFFFFLFPISLILMNYRC